jgi:hypothetical protein
MSSFVIEKDVYDENYHITHSIYLKDHSQRNEPVWTDDITKAEMFTTRARAASARESLRFIVNGHMVIKQIQMKL